VLQSPLPPHVDGWRRRLAAERYNQLRLRLPLPLFLPLPSFSFASPLPPPPLLLFFLDPAALRPYPGLPRLDSGRGHPSEPLCLGTVVDSGAPRALEAGPSALAMGDSVQR
jgi:hypothetical protein